MNKRELVKAIELFAGVGGFRVGLNKIKDFNDNGIAIENKKRFDFVYFNQWEPNSKIQHAYKCYIKRFGYKEDPLFSNLNICEVDKKKIPNHDLLVAGFPCQDYSVARSLNNEKGINGKKGILWWEIYKTIVAKKTKFLLLENVDRLLLSPSKQKGRDFSIILKCLNDLNYVVEWKVINAADYEMPQKRKRLFIFAYKKNTIHFKEFVRKETSNDDKSFEYLINNSLLSSIFKSDRTNKIKKYRLDSSIEEISNSLSSIYYDTGIMVNNKVYTCKTKPKNSNIYSLEKIILDENEVLNECYITNNDILKKLKYLKSSKRIKREKNGYIYKYSEGKMNFPEDITKPGRTMLTSEGTVNRSSHIIKPNGRYRYLDPKECELLNMFPKDWTNIEEISIRKRRFLMGNALVCGILNKISNDLYKIIQKEKVNA